MGRTRKAEAGSVEDGGRTGVLEESSCCKLKALDLRGCFTVFINKQTSQMNERGVERENQVISQDTGGRN